MFSRKSSKITEILKKVRFRLGFYCLTHFQQYFSYIIAVSFIGGGNRSTRRKPVASCCVFFFCVRHVLCVPNVASFSGLFILYCYLSKKYIYQNLIKPWTKTMNKNRGISQNVHRTYIIDHWCRYSNKRWKGLLGLMGPNLPFQ
jgi:hypothetical protein